MSFDREYADDNVKWVSTTLNTQYNFSDLT